MLTHTNYCNVFTFTLKQWHKWSDYWMMHDLVTFQWSYGMECYSASWARKPAIHNEASDASPAVIELRINMFKETYCWQ